MDRIVVADDHPLFRAALRSAVEKAAPDAAIEECASLVEVRAAEGDAAEVVAAENADRLAVYEAIARKTGSSVAAVGGARAKQIASGSKAGVWVQGEDGSWAKK